ncbi:hypothetical protein SLA2020_414400 [Shorea laevis]
MRTTFPQPRVHHDCLTTLGVNSTLTAPPTQPLEMPPLRTATVSPHNTHRHHRSAETTPNSPLVQHCYRTMSPLLVHHSSIPLPLCRTAPNAPLLARRSTVNQPK